MSSLSVVINTKNAERTLAQTLESVKWADEIVIVDMASTDQTKQIAKKYTQKIFNHPDVGYVEPARNFALQKAKSDWILVLDADEEVSSSLKSKIKHLVNGDATADAYFLSRKNIIFNSWYQQPGYWPDYVLRLFRNGSVEWTDAIHQPPIIHGTSDNLAATEENAIIHHHYETIEDYVDRMNRYTSHEIGRRQDLPATTERVVQSFEEELMRRMFKDRGIDGGFHGTALSFLQAFYEVLVVLKQWQQDLFNERHREQKSTIKALRNLQQNLNYWIADWQVEHSTGIFKVWWQIRRKFKI